MKTIPVEYRTDIPPSAITLAEKRTYPLIQFWGKHMISDPRTGILFLCMSCYLQGVEDAFKSNK